MKIGAFLFAVLVGGIAGCTGWLLGAAFAARAVAETNSNAATLYAGNVAAVVAVVAAVIAIWGVYSQRVLTRRQCTIQHIAALKSDRSIQEQIDKFIELTNGPNNLAMYADKQHEGGDDAQAINAVLNVYELIAVGIQNGIYEYRIVEQWQKSTIKKYWAAAHPYIVALRQRVNAPTIWSEYEKLNGWVSGTRSPWRALWWTGFN